MSALIVEVGYILGVNHDIIKLARMIYN